MRIVQKILPVIIFSAMGAVSYFLLQNYLGAAYERITSLGAAATVVCIFNLFGFTLLKVKEIMIRHYPEFYVSQWKLVVFYTVTALVLLLLNYAVFTLVKCLAGFANFLEIGMNGIRIIITLWLLELLVVGLFMVNHSLHVSVRFYKEKENLKFMADRARIKALQNQLNPHFLFNNLNTLVAEIECGDKDNAIRFVQELSDVYRYVLQHDGEDLVSLDEEIAFVKSYFFLHQVRMGPCVALDVSLPENTADAKLPPLSLQLLAENVIKHNYMDETHPVKISISVQEDACKLVFTNNVRKKQSPHESGVGLRNLSERYRLLCGKPVWISETEEYFTVELPLIYE